ncbi:MAG: hypothetical protein JNK85_17055 [Verrucomicrobiales bacterium]|nr:hypothetical protein [Verrucomicrobiales bacterium]
MKSLLHRLLLVSADSKSTWIPWTRLRPDQRQPFGLGLVALHVLSGFLWAGLPILVLSRGFLGRWSLPAFLIPGLFGGLAAALWFGMIRLAWNRRAAELNARPDDSLNRPEPTRVSGFERWVALPVLGMLVLLAAGSLVVTIENLRGIWLLRSVEAEFRQRGLAVTPAEVEPPAIPDDRNFAMAPFLKPLFAYEVSTPVRGTTNAGIRWLDPQGFAQVQGLFEIEARHPTFSGFAASQRRSKADSSKADSERNLGNELWIDGGALNLSLWQAYFRSLSNWTGSVSAQTPAKDVLVALGRHDTEYALLKAAIAERPDCRYPIRYADGSMAIIPHLAPLKRWVVFLRLRSVALLADGRTDDALADTMLAFHLSDGLRGEPILINLLVRMAMNNLILQPVWEGCRDRRWTEPQMAALQRALESADFLAELRQALVGERVLAGLAYDNMAQGGTTLNSWGVMDSDSDLPDDMSLRVFLTFMPRGWIRQSQVSHIRYVQALVDDLANARSYAQLAPPGQHLDRFISRKSLFNILAAMLAPAVDNASGRTYESEARRRLAVVGLALERHRLADGQYPTSLDALAPRFLGEVPSDPMDGKPLRYSSTPDGQYRLYSVGRDGQDDGGLRPTRRAKSAADPKRASDLVWR